MRLFTQVIQLEYLSIPSVLLHFCTRRREQTSAVIIFPMHINMTYPLQFPIYKCDFSHTNIQELCTLYKRILRNIYKLFVLSIIIIVCSHCFPFIPNTQFILPSSKCKYLIYNVYLFCLQQTAASFWQTLRSSTFRSSIATNRFARFPATIELR